MNPYPEQPIEVLQARLDETEGVIADWSKRIRRARALFILATIDLVVSWLAFIYIWGLLVVSFVRYQFLDDVDALPRLVLALSGLVFWLWIKWSPRTARASRARARLSLIGARSFQATGKGVAEALRAKIAERSDSDGR